MFWQLLEKKKEIIVPENESREVLSFQKWRGDCTEEDNTEYRRHIAEEWKLDRKCALVW